MKGLQIVNLSSRFEAPLGDDERWADTLIGELRIHFRRNPEFSDLPTLLTVNSELPTVFLVNESEFDYRTNLKDSCDDRAERPSTEFFGVYIRKRVKFNFHVEILLCPERIMLHACHDPDLYQLLFKKVLLHELAHLLMDICMENSSYAGDAVGHELIEESCANLFALSLMGGNSYIRDFVKLQPWNYSFGRILYDHFLNEYAYPKKEISKFITSWRKRKLILCGDDSLVLITDKVIRGNFVEGIDLLIAQSGKWNDFYHLNREKSSFFYKLHYHE